jgi:DNA replication protein DnaC
VAEYDAWLAWRSLATANEERAKRRTAWGVPGRFQAPHPDFIWTPTAALDHAWTYATGAMLDGRALIVLGPTGLGKTVAAAAVIDLWTHDGPRQSVRWFSAPPLIRMLADFDEREKTLARVSGVGFLVLDDVGAGTFKPHRSGEALLEEALCARAHEQRPTLITSNCTPKAFAKLFADRLVDRLRPWADICVVTGTSLQRPSA